MIKLAALFAAFVVAAGCGDAAQHSSNSGPPEAFIDSGARVHRMLQGTSCWQSGNSGRCADAAGIETLLPMMPRLVVKPGAAAHIQLGFDPDRADLTIGGRKVAVDAGQSITFTPTRAGVANLWLTADQGDAEYLARIVFAR